jgi:hypothetical protein
MDEIREAERAKAYISKENYTQTREEIKDKITEEIELMQTEMNSKKVNIYNALENLFQKFMTDSKDKFRQYSNLLESNTSDSNAIDETMQKVTRTKEKIKSLISKIYNMEKDFNHKNSQIQKENDEINKNLFDLKEKMFHFRNTQKKKLVKLSCHTSEVIDKLELIYKQGERILKNTSLCRKLEFENEKISTIKELEPQREEESERILEDYTADERRLLDSCKKFESLKGYFSKYNKVLFEKLAAEKESSDLRRENQLLTKKLEGYLEGLTISDKTLAYKNNSLMSVSTKASMEFDGRRSSVQTVDANSVMRKYALQNYRA